MNLNGVEYLKSKQVYLLIGGLKVVSINNKKSVQIF